MCLTDKERRGMTFGVCVADKNFDDFFLGFTEIMTSLFGVISSIGNNY